MTLNTNIINFQSCSLKTDTPNTLNTILNIIKASNQDIVSMNPFPEGISYNFVWLIQYTSNAFYGMEFYSRF